MKRADVVIAGAGIAGIAIAHRLAEHHGITDIVLVDPRPPLTFTSDKTGANYRDWWPVRPLVELTRRSIQLMSEMLDSGAAFTVNRRGYLYVSTRREFRDTLPGLLAPYAQAGAGPLRMHEPSGTTNYEPASPTGRAGAEGADVLDPEIIRRTFPHFSPSVTGAIHARNAGTLDTVALGQYLLAAAMRHGVRLVRGEVTRIDVTGSRIRKIGIVAEDGSSEIATRHFVNAAGPFAGRVARLMNVTLPVINVRQQKVAIPDPLGAVPPDAPFTISLDPQGSLPAGLHIKPGTSGGRAVIKLGCAFNKEPEEPDWEPRVTTEFPGLVLRAAAELIPALESHLDRPPAPVAHEAGYYTRTPDELPLIGPLGVDGAYIVGGLAGFGAMVACAAAEIAASWIAGTARPAWTKSFEPGRFTAPGHGQAIVTEERLSGAL
ncbi:MAG: FAD-binding oxidoreductase [Gemmatimonadetes bacterium]|nr:FAD-binding oxidoreductase [Gemmatimonadota bacterium]